VQDGRVYAFIGSELEIGSDMAIGTSDLLASAMKWLSWREGLHTRNVSNLDVAGFVPSDAKRSFAESVDRQSKSTVGMVRTSGLHLEGKPATLDDVSLVHAEPKLNGNEVVLETEMTKLTEISAQSQLASSVYKKNMQFFKIVLGTNRG
jgi:flagellar basal-body rod protein FlgB